MVSPIASRPPSAHQVHAPRTAPAEQDNGPGRSAESVGHRAKAAIAEAAGGTFGANIQGKIASMLAHHLDISSVLAPGEPGTHTDEIPPELGIRSEEIPPELVTVDDPVPEPEPPVAGTVDEDPLGALPEDGPAEQPGTQAA